MLELQILRFCASEQQISPVAGLLFDVNESELLAHIYKQMSWVRCTELTNGNGFINLSLLFTSVSHHFPPPSFLLPSLSSFNSLNLSSFLIHSSDFKF